MKHPHRKLSWMAILDIILVILTIVVIIIAIIKAATRPDTKSQLITDQLPREVIIAPEYQRRELSLEPILEELIHEEVPGFCNLEYCRRIIVEEYQIAPIDVQLLEIEYEQAEARALAAAKVEEPKQAVVFDLSEREQRMLAALVTLEVGSESYECQKAVVSVVLNRMITGNKSLHDVIYEEYQFSVAPKVTSTEPKERCVEAVRDVLENGTTIPTYVTFFRAGHYHDWGDRYKQYAKIDRTYFSYDVKLKEAWPI